MFHVISSQYKLFIPLCGLECVVIIKLVFGLYLLVREGGGMSMVLTGVGGVVSVVVFPQRSCQVQTSETAELNHLHLLQQHQQKVQPAG